MYVVLFFFFSSRRRHTRLQGDWSSDVCSSDLHAVELDLLDLGHGADVPGHQGVGLDVVLALYRKQVSDLERAPAVADEERSEERRVGKECRSRWSPYH